MTPRHLELALRRQRLSFQADTLRRELAESLRPFQPAFSAADAVGRGFRYLKSHPEVPATVAAMFLVLKPRRAFRWLRRGFVAWRLTGALRRKLTVG